MTTTTELTAESTYHVGCARLADGIVVQLAGALTSDELPVLREMLLTPLPDGCLDVVIDAGGITEIDDSVLAVLLAAREWIGQQGGRLLLSRSSRQLDRALRTTGLQDDLPRLGRPDAQSLPLAVPYPRTAS